jgi:hypothetical protein
VRPEDEAQAWGSAMGSFPNRRSSDPVAAWRPKPAEVVDFRAALVREWASGGIYARSLDEMRNLGVGQGTVIDWERQMLAEARLWFVGGAMCELLTGAAPGLPAVELEPEMLPDEVGLVAFEVPVIGRDGADADKTVTVGAMMWGPTWFDGVTEHPWPEPRRCLGISVYGPMNAYPWLLPTGSVVWPFGEPPEFALTGEVQRDASMAEDRRRLLALWLLSSQPGVATESEAVLPRQVVRRATRAGREPPKVRVIHLRHVEGGGHEAGDRSYHHRWLVSGHWRQQAVGPGHSQRRPTYIHPHLKGPEGAPLLPPTTVKAWTR